jgi:hemin uptake protein HemP
MTESSPIDHAGECRALGAPPDAAAKTTGPRRIASSEILCGERLLLITHGDETYRLLVTRNNKLILQK